MTISSMVALFTAMLVLALYPGVSALTVASRSATHGFIQGVFTTSGILTGDIIFILLAVSGLSMIADSMQDLFLLVKYAGGGYLIWLGFSLWRSKSTLAKVHNSAKISALSSFISGLLITLADVKAIFFYLGFLPAFVDLASLSAIDILFITIISIVAVGSAKLSYAILADKASDYLKQPTIVTAFNVITGSIMLVTGLYLIMK